MTPLELQICLHYHTHVEEMQWIFSGAPITEQTMDDLVHLDLLKRNPKYKQGKGAVQFLPTEKLHAYVEILCETPLPIQKWIDPRKDAK